MGVPVLAEDCPGNVTVIFGVAPADVVTSMVDELPLVPAALTARTR